MSDDIAARIAIRDLIDRYTDAINRRDYGVIANLFAETGVWRVGPPYDLQFDGARSIAEFLAAALQSYDLLIQMAMGSVIDLGEGGAKARTTMREVVRGPGEAFVQYGVYADDFVRVGDKWRFAARLFHPLYREEMLMSGPSFPLNIG